MTKLYSKWIPKFSVLIKGNKGDNLSVNLYSIHYPFQLLTKYTVFFRLGQLYFTTSTYTENLESIVKHLGNLNTILIKILNDRKSMLHGLGMLNFPLGRFNIFNLFFRPIYLPPNPGSTGFLFF